jgi:ATP-dependent DNA ligase
MIKMPLLLDKEESPSEEIIRLFEKTRVAYLSAREDPKEYGGRWRRAVEDLRELRSKTDALGSVLEDYLNENLLERNDALDPQTNEASKVYESIKNMRLSADEANDPFTKKYKDKVLEVLLEEPETMAKFVHYALRNGNDALPKKVWSIKDMQPDEITDGFPGLDLEVDDIPLYIIEQYGDGKDSNKVESKVSSALDLLEMFYLSEHKEEELDELKEIEKAEKSVEEKAQSDFLVPNKPMYRIFDIEDLNELKGFSGNWVIQEKYDGMRIQIHKIDDKVKIYSYNEKDITDKCPGQVKEMKQKQYGDCILDAELILFDEDEPLHRADTIAHVFKGKYPNATLRAHVFDIMRHENRSLVEEPFEDRITILFNNYSSRSSTEVAFPSKKDTRMADNIKDVESYSKEIMEMPTSEGVVIKDATSTYYIGTRKNPKWIKWKKFVDLDLIVLDVKKTKSNLYSYTLGAGPTEGEGKHFREIEGKIYMDVGKALNTKISAKVGDIIRVKVDEVKPAGDRYTVFSAKVIEIPEVEAPDKIVTLDMLSQDTKKSLNYDVSALEKGIKVTDFIHGEATLIIKSDYDGFTIYGFEESNLMSKNAIADLDMWKAQAEEIMKTKQARLTVSIINFLKEQGPKTVRELHNFLKKKKSEEYEDVLESKERKLMTWAEERDGISYDMSKKKLFAETDKLIKSEYKTPEEYRKGMFKIYLRKDGNLDFSIRLGDENLVWYIELPNKDAIFELFGKAGKFPAEVSKSKDREDLLDAGDIELGVQKEGYHEYFLKGNKFETKLHIRVIPVKDEKMWLAWTGYKQTPADKEGDEGLWNIYEDRYNTLTIPES